MRKKATVLDPAETWRKAEAKAKREKLELAFEQQLKAAKIDYRTQFQWNPNRKWRADFYIWQRGTGIVVTSAQEPLIEILVEIEGGNWSQGRHVRGRGFEADVEKYNEAALARCVLLRGTAKHIKNGQLLEWVERALK